MTPAPKLQSGNAGAATHWNLGSKAEATGPVLEVRTPIATPHHLVNETHQHVTHTRDNKTQVSNTLIRVSVVNLLANSCRH